MSQIKINFNDVPDEMLPVESGEYTVAINEMPTLRTNDKGENSWSVVYTITSDGPMKGRKIYDQFGTKWLQDTSSIVAIRMKRLIIAAGLKIADDGFDLADLVGKELRIIVSHRVGKDAQTGEQKTFAQVKDYVK